VYWRTPANRSSEQEKIMTEAIFERPTQQEKTPQKWIGKKSAPMSPSAMVVYLDKKDNIIKEKNSKFASAKTPREKDLERLELITSRVLAGEELKAVILDVCADVAEILEDQTQQKRSLIGELSHSQKFSKKINATFGTLYGEKHNHSPALTETVSTENMGVFVINIRKIGETERNREIVEEMLRNPELRPIAYADRPAKNGKKPSLEKFFNDTYGAFRDSGSIYLNEIKILDEGLYKYLGSAGKHITTTMKKCTDHVNADIALLAKVSKRAENVMKSLYGR
jgi:hypothetical protein